MHHACCMHTIVCILHAIVSTLHTMVCSLLTIACRLHSAGICIRSVNTPIGNAGLNSGVDPGITGVDALHAGCVAGVDALKNTP
jgi:hypothetical protein